MLNVHKLSSRKQQCHQETQTAPTFNNNNRSSPVPSSASAITSSVDFQQELNKMMMLSSLGGFDGRCTSVDVVVRDLRENVSYIDYIESHMKYTTIKKLILAEYQFGEWTDLANLNRSKNFPKLSNLPNPPN